MKKNKKEEDLTVNLQDSLTINMDEANNNKQVLAKGRRTLKDMLAPVSIDRSNEDYIKIGNKFARTYSINGYPSAGYVTFLDDIFDYNGVMDCCIHVDPSDARLAHDELTKQITSIEAQLDIETKAGRNKEITRLMAKRDSLMEERIRIEQNQQNLFHVYVGCTLYDNTLDGLESKSQVLERSLSGHKIMLLPNMLKMDEGYTACLPLGINPLLDKFRNFNTGALTACFPFYNSEISHPNGIFIGVNMTTSTPIYLDFQLPTLNNKNALILGESGSGKTFLVSLITMRSCLFGLRSAIVDPEGDYCRLTESLGGVSYTISKNSKFRLNPFDIEEDVEIDENGEMLGEAFVDVDDKVADLVNLLCVMAGDAMTDVCASLVSEIIQKLYANFGITRDPKSLIESDDHYDFSQQDLNFAGGRKKMPTFSDFYKLLVEYVRNNNSAEMKRLADVLLQYKRGGVYDIFDCYSTVDLSDFSEAPIINFDVHELEESRMRPIGMYISMNWIWEKFVKKDLKTKKRVICDEAWMLLSTNMRGYEYTSKFLETSARRIRKRNGSLLVASQNFHEFVGNKVGQAILANCSINIFLKQDNKFIDAFQDYFKVSDGETNFLTSCKRGQGIIKIAQETAVVSVKGFPYEASLIERSYLKDTKN